MNAALPFDGIELWYIAGWTMLHFLWLGTLIGVVAAACRLALRRANSNIRYAVALGCLTILAVLPIGIAIWLIDNSPISQLEVSPAFVGDVIHDGNEVQTEIIELNNPRVGMPAPGERVEAIAATKPSTNIEAMLDADSPLANVSLKVKDSAFAAVAYCVPYLPWLWIIGTPITFALLAAGVIGTKRLRSASQAINDSAITELLARLVASLRVSQRVTVAVCDRVAAPVLVGILRPIILLPPAAITGWSPDEIEMVLLHELAHVRRWDNLINLLQRLVESLLFFHPAVWLVSNWVRREREACCDAIVVGRTKRPHAYAEMLVALAAQMPRSVLFHPAASSAMAAGPLRARIRRILQLEDDPMLISGKSFALLLAGLLLAATLTVLYLPTIGQAEESATEATESTELKEPNDGHEAETPLSIESPEGKRIRATARQIEVKDGQLRLHGVQSIEQVAPAAVGNKNLADDWPAGIAFPSPKEGEIARRVWKKLGLKIIPTTSDEQLGTGFPFKVVGGVPTPPGGNNGLMLLVSLGAFERNSADGQASSLKKFDTKTFDELASALEKIEGRDLIVAECLTDTERGLVTIQVVTAGRATLPEMQTRKFPSLEDQKLADLAYKRLGLEMESIGEEDLKRVKALGYDGGLKVTVGAAGVQGRSEMIQTGDILVGLHVWPTTSMKALAEILNRDDLAELNPLKVYVIRQASEEGDEQLRDFVFTGRVSINIGGGGGGGGFGGGRSSPRAQVPADIKPRPVVAENNPYAAPRNPPYGQKFAASRDELEVLREHIELLEAQFKNLDARYQAGKPPASLSRRELAGYELALVQGELALAEGDRKQAVARLKQALKHAVAALKAVTADYEAGRVVHDLVLQAARNVSNVKRKLIQLESATPSEGESAASPLSDRTIGNAADKSALRYDGKTFDDWRTEWQTELSTKKRLEAVKALAAFGRAGYGKEASEAILDVAGEYDFYMIDQSTEGKLKETVIAELAPENRGQTLAKYWVPDLATRLEKEPKKWRWLANNVLSRLRTDDPTTMDVLHTLAENGPTEVRTAALEALVMSNRSRSGGPQIDDRTRELLIPALKSTDPAVICHAVAMLLYNPPSAVGERPQPQLVFYSELMPLLFHSDSTVQQAARHGLRYIQRDNAVEVLEKLVAILKDESRKDDHLAAVRALSALGPYAEPNVPQLERILGESQDISLRVAAGFAIDSIERGGRARNALMRQADKLQDEKKQTQFTRLFNAEVLQHSPQ